MSKRGVVLNDRAREIIWNVDQYFESEKQHNLELIHQLKAASILSGPEHINLTRELYSSIIQKLQNAAKVTERVQMATGINKNTITRIRQEKRDAQASCSKVVEGLSSQKRTDVEIISIAPQTTQNLPQTVPSNLPIQSQNLPFQPQSQPIQLQNLPIQPQNLPFQPQNLPTQSQNLPTQSQNLPFHAPNLPIPQTLVFRQQNPPFVINPNNILKLSLKDMLEAPSKLQPQTKIKIEVEEEESNSNNFSGEGSCSSDFDEVIQASTVQLVSHDPLLVPRQDQPMSWPEIEVPPLLPTSIKNEVVFPADLPENTLLNKHTSPRGLREPVKVTATTQKVTAKDTSKDKIPVKSQRNNDLLAQMLSNPPKGEELFLRPGVPEEPKGDEKNCEEDKMKVIILNSKELEDLRAKRRSHHSYINSQYKCEKCIDFYQSQEKIDEHNLKHDESRGNKICDICEQRFPNENELNDHYKAHFIVYECMKCQYRNRSRMLLYEHCRRKHVESSFYCKRCFKQFKTFKERRMHIDHEHHEKRACKECDKTFANLSRLKEHVLKMHRLELVECPICKKMIKTHYLSKHVKTHNEKDNSFYCVECDAYYKTKLSYRLHLQTTLKHNTLEKLGLKCDHCDKYFARRESLKNHIAEIGGVKYTCDICKKVSKSKKTLTTHIATVHKKIQRNYKPKICEVCGKSFTARKSLVEHLNSHLGVRPHVCEDCGATFIYSAALFTHRRLKHKVKRKSEVASQVTNASVSA